MAYRNGNYSAFYVDTPFNQNNLGANSTYDFVYYNLLKAWKAGNNAFPFCDSHDKNYNVRDNSDWETTLKPRLRERLRNSKNILLFLSSITKESKALKEEIDYGINVLGLPVIVIYPEYKEKGDIVYFQSGMFKESIKKLWNNLPIFRDSMAKVPTLHIPLKKELVEKALSDSELMIGTKSNKGRYFYKC